MKRLLSVMCFSLLFACLAAGAAEAQTVVIEGVGTAIDRSRLIVDPSAGAGKINFIVWELRELPRQVLYLNCDDSWDSDKVQRAIVMIKNHMNTTTDIQFLRVLSGAGLTCAQKFIRQ